MKYCVRCHLEMINSFKGCPHCQTDKYIVDSTNGKPSHAEAHKIYLERNNKNGQKRQTS